MKFPFETHEKDLEPEDLVRFGTIFSRAVANFLPCPCGTISFIAAHECAAGADLPVPWSGSLGRLQKTGRPAIAEDGTLLLPLWNGKDFFAAAVVEGIDRDLAEKMSGEWLSDLSRGISKEVRLLKQVALDPLTGLPNARQFREELALLLAEPGEQQGDEERHGFSLVLYELQPQARELAKSLKNLVRSGAGLASCAGDFPVYFLGGCLFGQIWHGYDAEQAGQAANLLLRCLRSDDLRRVHIGISAYGDQRPAAGSPEQLLDEAWLALKAASRRGPFGICVYDFISDPAGYPIRKAPPLLLARLRGLWRGLDSFALILFRVDRENGYKKIFKRLQSLVEGRAVLLAAVDREFYVFMANADEQAALAWVKKFKKKLGRLSGLTFSAGVAVFPFHGFSRSATAMNARKALLHTEFFGPDTVTAFDAVSLNISGDIYYEAGDLVRATKEYRQGLELDQANTNLLNSLGETYARMNRQRAAALFFERVLALERDNYMALFNLGVCCLNRQDDERAMACFEKASAVAGGDGRETQNLDLLVHLGRLYCKAGRYEETVRLFEGFERLITAENNIEPAAGKKNGWRWAGALRCLGEAYKELGRHREAMTVLQRALRHNSRDAASMSLLGELYGLEKQGDDIALLLCTKAVELDDRPWEFWYRLARTRFRLGDFAAAGAELQECLDRNRNSVAALYLAGQVSESLGQGRQARKIYEKILKIEPAHKDAAAALEKTSLSLSRGDKEKMK